MVDLHPQFGLPEERAASPFSLGRWFMTVGLVAIAVPAVLGALALSRLFEDRLLRQEGRLTMQFVQGIIDVEDAASYFTQPAAVAAPYMEQLLAHIARAPDVLRTNLYSRDRRIIWSSDAALTGRGFAGDANTELDAALGGALVIHEESSDENGGAKAEHANLRPRDGRFIELYVPVRDSGQDVVGAVELYRASGALHETIASATRLIWAGALGAAAVLYFALLPLVRRADRILREQQDRIVETETLAATGDLASAVAHGIRNPLSVIRTSAEIMREQAGPEGCGEAAREIMDQVDRLEHWIRELLTYVHLPAGEQQRVDVEDAARRCLAQFESEMRRRGIETVIVDADGAATVRGDVILLEQVFRSIVANAVEAMPAGGRVTLTLASGAQGATSIRIRDSGPGMNAEQLATAMKPFHTTKAKGLGVGLPLARRIIERMGGRISIASAPGEGTTVELILPEARE